MKTHERWEILDILLTFVLIIVASLVVVLVDDRIITQTELPFLMIFDFIGMSVVYFVFIRQYKLKIRQFYNTRLIALVPIFIVIAVVVKFMQVAVANGLGDLILLYEELFKVPLSAFFHFILSEISGLILAPIWEEFLFRGVIFWVLSRRFGPVVAIVVPSLLFALLHIDPNAFTNYNYLFISIILALFVESVLKSYIVYKTESLTIPTLMHIAGNIVALLIELLYKQMGIVGQ
jgi:membrane protease YdiL (CAAX protease family)